MLWAVLTEDGVLIIRAESEIEAFALKQWERQRKAGKASLRIESGLMIDAEKILKSAAKSAFELRRWNEKGTFFTNDELKDVKINSDEKC
jgi:hypothetical protein